MSSKYQQALRYVDNPNVKKMLSLIMATEGTTKHKYNTAFGGGYVDDLSRHPNIRKTFKQTDGKTNVTSAFGAYQFVKPTWDGLVRQGLPSNMAPRNQDIGAVMLMIENGALPHVLKGDFNTAVRKSGRTWASLPSSTYAQGKRSDKFVQQFLAKEGVDYTASATGAAMPVTVPGIEAQQIQQPQMQQPAAALPTYAGLDFNALYGGDKLEALPREAAAPVVNNPALLPNINPNINPYAVPDMSTVPLLAALRKSYG